MERKHWKTSFCFHAGIWGCKVLIEKRNPSSNTIILEDHPRIPVEFMPLPVNKFVSLQDYKFFWMISSLFNVILWLLWNFLHHFFQCVFFILYHVLKTYFSKNNRYSIIKCYHNDWVITIVVFSINIIMLLSI